MIVSNLFALSSYYITHVDADRQAQIRNTQEITQGVNQNKGNHIENWLSTVPLSLENLVDPFLQKTLENIPLNAGLSSHDVTRITLSAGGVRATNFRSQLCDHNIFISYTDAPKELMERAMRILPKNWQLQHKTLRLRPSRTW